MLALELQSSSHWQLFSMHTLIDFFKLTNVHVKKMHLAERTTPNYSVDQLSDIQVFEEILYQHFFVNVDVLSCTF